MLAIVAAVMFHLAILLFGGLIFGAHKDDQGSLQKVDLLSAAETEAEKEKPKDPTQEQEPQTEEPVDTQAEDTPDLAEVLKELDRAPTAAPALEAASLSAIEAALFGGGAGGDLGFGSALSFASGGVIGGTGKAGALESGAPAAFDMAEIDQRPRELFRSAPNYPAEMRGKKVEGTVTLIFIVDETGKVIEPKVVSSTHTAFEKPALQALRQWKFEPGVRGGKRVASRSRVSIRFTPSNGS
jgi:TonB family protein